MITDQSTAVLLDTTADDRMGDLPLAGRGSVTRRIDGLTPNRGPDSPGRGLPAASGPDGRRIGAGALVVAAGRRSAGRRTAVAEGQRAPSGMHMAHAEVWLALREYGPAAGFQLNGWWTDRAGWQEWTGGNATGGGRGPGLGRTVAELPAVAAADHHAQPGRDVRPRGRQVTRTAAAAAVRHDAEDSTNTPLLLGLELGSVSPGARYGRRGDTGSARVSGCVGTGSRRT
jgi:hypothetical protein